MARRLQLGVIGCGVIGRRHIAAAARSDRIGLVAVADMRHDVAQALASEFGIRRAYASADEMIRDAGVDAVVLALPTAARSGLAVAALRAGKHVLLEKPPAMHLAEIDAMMRTRPPGLVVACASSRFRLYESARVATEFVARGALGPIRLVRFRGLKPAGTPPTSPPPPWRLSRRLNGGGILVNWGIYDLDYLLGLLGWTLRPQTVLAQTWPVPPIIRSHVAEGSDAEAHVTALIRCADGAAISLDRGEFTPIVADEAWQIIGDSGALRLTMIPGQNRVLHDELTEARGVVTQVLWSGSEDYGAVHAGPVLDFAGAILDDRPPATSLEHARVLQQLIDAVYTSADTGRAVEID